MAARTLKPFQQEQVKQHIQTTQILKRIQNYALGDLDIDYPRVQACFKLLEFRLSKALPEEVSNNLAANAVAQIAQTQLYLMAQEMVRQGIQEASTLTEVSYTLAEDAHVIVDTPATVETSTDESEQTLTKLD